MLARFKSPLLLQVMLAVFILVALQTLLTLSVTKSSINSLVDNLALEFKSSNQSTQQTIDLAQQAIANAMLSSTQKSQRALDTSLNHGLNEAQKNISDLVANHAKQSIQAQATLLASVSPPYIWDKDIPKLTELVIAAHQNPKVLFAIYFDAQGKYLTRHIDRSSAKVTALIEQGTGRRKMDKLISGAKLSKQVYIAEADINPKGSVIGKFIIAVDTSEQAQLNETLGQQFSSLIDTSANEVEQVLNNEAKLTQQTLNSSLDKVREGNQQTANNINQAVQENVVSLISDLWVILLCSAVALLVALTFIISNRILSKITMLTSALQNLARGGGDLTQKISIHSKDEIGAMAHSVNAFLEKTRKLIIEANLAADQTASQSQTMQQKSAGVYQALTKQQQEVDVVASAMVQVMQNINQEEAEVQKVMSSIDQVKTDSEQNNATSQHVKRLIEQLVERVSQTNQRVGQFEQLSLKIGSVLDVIQGIAEQTNLLALNAAIEAARAGETGRGFAVVADEVRTLASRTQSSTLEIQQSIEALQTEARTLVNEMESTFEHANEGINELNQADALQDAIFHSIAELYEMIENIAQLSKQQVDVTHEVNQSTERMQDACASSLLSVEQANEVSEQLSSLSAKLKQTMSQFKVD
ncbi:methyl-accepting chemotaxis protein [Motilimonas sp. E26]|uniref:methyl-accepting chemotaxis protein n=1 Tax=Motilimonas sp. E26 TaxID=2865674 RepID=UPI00249DDF62|nr:methyl-accepting chemotaxis protein [Motilimonas sp. E26]MCE0556173.1 methyl-accepting chemotaxis protein [Motilimonas sp. E26]